MRPQLVRLSGFGMTTAADAWQVLPSSDEDVRQALRLAKAEGRRIVLRGAGRSYGDAAIRPEAVAVSFERMRRILSWDAERGILAVEAGGTVGDLWRFALPDGWWPPVVSGTMFPTVGGAIAMNIHGKNAFREGTLGEHLAWIDVMDSEGQVHRVRPEDPAFRAIVGGAGLVGIILRAAIRMKRVPSGDLRVLAVAARNWREQFEVFSRHENEADYLVSWVDCFARGSSAGRGLIHAAWYSEGGRSTLSLEHQELPDTILGLVPKSVVWRFLKALNRRSAMRALNGAKYRLGTWIGNGKMEHQSLVAFSFLLDYVPNWRWAYLPGGFIQYQSFVPKEAAPRVFESQVALQQRLGLEAFLGVLKRHRPDGFLLSHGVDGYSLALDFKVTPRNRERVWSMAHQMNELVLEAGGQFYLAKDSTLRPQDLRRWLGPRLQEWREWKRLFDPSGLLTSSLAERTGLIDP
ncbi:MAG: FAD-binding oxidoreductase [Fimbriimonadales bacterium]|nr:FAD-binding oxidoreductase [Fimbriimonadales bacterium]